MQVKETGIQGLVEIFPSAFPDERGWFFEFYKEEVFRKNGIPTAFPQENISFSKKGVLRGLHFQRPPYAQGKLVTVIKGKVLDIVVDLRIASPTFGKTYYCTLDGEKHNMLMVPEGFAHGFVALEESFFYYKCTNVYSKAHESGIVWNDPDLKIQWPVENPIVSDKDQLLPTFQELLRNSVISQH
ncbi:MAG TPA: dTDP-4-dehydrorhamnose 3,5-epimerase [Chryseosolibacter sp.]|nr:dTDP-4-dehydrorhamnose 3,5-epimerase [Chryseosolibacter sp.]